MSRTVFLAGENSLTLIIIIAVVAVVVIAGLTALGIALYLHHFKSGLENLEKDYSTYHTQLTTDCAKMVKRLGILGKSNDYFQKMYEEKQKQYDELLSKRDKALEKEIRDLRDQVERKNHKDYGQNKEKCLTDLDEFRKSVGTFSSDLTAILQDDNDIHSAAVAVKEKYRRIRNFLSEHSEELKPLDHSFQLVLAEADKDFESFDRSSDAADFNEAKKTLTDLSKLLGAVVAVMEDLPMIESSLTTALPRDIDACEKQYEEMLKGDYDLSDMVVPSKIASMRERVKKLQDQLVYLDTTGAYDTINKIQDEITDILARFQEEVEARKTFLGSQSSLSDSSYEIEKRYSSLMNSLPNYQATYVLSEEEVSAMDALKNDIEGIGFLKRQLDGYLDTSSRRPYTVITRKMSEMTGEMQKAKKTMDDYVAYLEDLKKTSEDVFLGLRSYYLKLKVGEREVNDIAVASYNESTKKEFAHLYNEIEEINKIILTCPIDVTAAKTRYNSFANETTAFLDSVDKTSKAASLAEKTIVEANIYRPEFADAAKRLDEAEKDFYAASFQDAYQIAFDVIQEFNKPTPQAAA